MRYLLTEAEYQKYCKEPTTELEYYKRGVDRVIKEIKEEIERMMVATGKPQLGKSGAVKRLLELREGYIKTIVIEREED